MLKGRINDDTNEVRNEFLDALYSYLEENRPNRDLDFVYGTLQCDEDDDHIHFIPLDGQQRLTTLFLLHWFLFQISKNEEAKSIFKAKMTSSNKSLFAYETRQSSTDFCDALMQATINTDQLVVIKGKDGQRGTLFGCHVKKWALVFPFLEEWPNHTVYVGYAGCHLS